MFSFTKPMSLKDFTFIIPSLSVGNVPQLAVDLVIESQKMEKIGIGFHAAIAPVIGPPAFAHIPEPTTSCEVFASEEKKLVALQLRAPISAKLLNSFLEDLVTFLSESAPKQVVVLGSCFSHERHDLAMKRKLEYVGNQKFLDEFGEQLEAFERHPENKLVRQGFAAKLYEAMEGKLDIPLGVLYAYVSEGDNVPDAKELSLFLNEMIKIFAEPHHAAIPVPLSWKLFFGNAGPTELF